MLCMEKVREEFTVTYTDGVDGEEVFADEVYTVKEDDATPAFQGELKREGYVFAGWTPAVTDTVTKTVVYTGDLEGRPQQQRHPGRGRRESTP